jgi:hypothetical protein
MAILCFRHRLKRPTETVSLTRPHARNIGSRSQARAEVSVSRDKVRRKSSMRNEHESRMRYL